MEKPRLGKLTPEELRTLVLRHIPLAVEVGLDANEVRLNGETLVISHDPAVGVPLEALGFFAFHYVAADQLSKRALPRYAVLGMYFPPSSGEDEIEEVARRFGEEAAKYGVKVVAGHTGRYEGVELPIISVTMMGFKVAATHPPKPGDLVLVSGILGLEAMWLKLAAERPECRFDFKVLTPVPILLDSSKMSEVKLAHDVGEGGLASALLELAQAYNVGFYIHVEPEIAKGLTLDEAVYAPSFGCAVLIVDRDSAGHVVRKLKSKGHKVKEVGEVARQPKVKILDLEVNEYKRSSYDLYYGQHT